MKLELRSVRIKNCGPIDDIKLDFFDAAGKTLPVCVIGGANGSGKTTILEVIVSLAELKATKRIDASLASRPDAYVQTDWKFCDLELSLFKGQLPDDKKLQQSFYGLQHTDSKIQLVAESQLTAEQLPQIAGFALSPLFDAINTNITSYPDSFPSLIYLPHNRSLEPVTGEQMSKEEDHYQFVYRFQTVRQFPGSLNSYLIYLDYAYPERYAQIQQFLNNLGFEGKTFRVDRKAFDVMVKAASGQEHRLHELSSGEQNLLIILIELRRKLTPGSIVLIDEIENSLHPAFQHRLAQGLLTLQREIPYQLIVTTHAPAFVEIFGAENTRLLTAF